MKHCHLCTERCIKSGDLRAAILDRSPELAAAMGRCVPAPTTEATPGDSPAAMPPCGPRYASGNATPDPTSEIWARAGTGDPITMAIADMSRLLTIQGLICLDFADIRAVLHDQPGLAAFGTGEASGLGRAIRAAEAAIADLRRSGRAILAGRSIQS